MYVCSHYVHTCMHVYIVNMSVCVCPFYSPKMYQYTGENLCTCTVVRALCHLHIHVYKNLTMH